jgi:hypothetical protein
MQEIKSCGMDPLHVPQLCSHALLTPLLLQECTGNQRIKNYTSRGINCWSGNDDEAHDARHDSGAVGVISVTSNIIPGKHQALLQAFWWHQQSAVLNRKRRSHSLEGRHHIKQEPGLALLLLCACQWCRNCCAFAHFLTGLMAQMMKTQSTELNASLQVGRRGTCLAMAIGSHDEAAGIGGQGPAGVVPFGDSKQQIQQGKLATDAL